MQVTELIMKNYGLAQSLQMKLVRDPSVRPAPEHPPVIECTTTITADREYTNQNQQTPKQNQQNPPAKIKSGKANQEKNQQHQQMQKQSNASKTETKQADNRNQKQHQQKRSEKKQQQQSRLEQNQDCVIMLRSPEWKRKPNQGQKSQLLS